MNKIDKVESGQIVFSYNLNRNVEVLRTFETFEPTQKNPKKFLVVDGLTAPATAAYFKLA